MRHGEPDVPELNGKIKASEFQDCLDIYNRCGLSERSRPDDAVLNFLKNHEAIVASDFKRSLESASVLSHRDSIIIDPMFREVERPYVQIPFFRLHPRTWSTIYILLWLLGFLNSASSFKEAKSRAKHCATKLIQLAEEHGKVLVVGHGFINAYIAKELRSLGWNGPGIPSKRYWEFGVYRKDMT